VNMRWELEFEGIRELLATTFYFRAKSSEVLQVTFFIQLRLLAGSHFSWLRRTVITLFMNKKNLYFFYSVAASGNTGNCIASELILAIKIFTLKHYPHPRKIKYGR
jgi:hypothetical protein